MHKVNYMDKIRRNESHITKKMWNIKMKGYRSKETYENMAGIWDNVV